MGRYLNIGKVEGLDYTLTEPREMPKPEYWALIGDDDASRLAPDRAKLQRILEANLQRLTHSQTPAATLTMTLGDEFDALYTRPTPLIDAILTLTDTLRPFRHSFGGGYGALATDL